MVRSVTNRPSPRGCATGPCSRSGASPTRFRVPEGAVVPMAWGTDGERWMTGRRFGGPGCDPCPAGGYSQPGEPTHAPSTITARGR